jgi:hypothetical protein
MFVFIFHFSIPLVAGADSFTGRDHEYQTLNIAFATNVVKSGMIIRLFPKPLKLCVATSTRFSLSPNTL